MKHSAGLALLAASVVVTGCASKDTVVFVTSSSIGINVDSKPPTASVGYDRTEGYSGPRSANGGMPEVVASLKTGNGLFNPRVRQLYATGAAALKTVDPDAADGPATLSGDAAGRKQAFFGTTTNLGFKIGFGAEGPETFSFGYKRKEFSYIPLAPGVAGDGGEGDATAVYPSVLASIDTTSTAGGNGGNSGLTSEQYFATGQAAEALATDPRIAAVFKATARGALASALTEQQIADATAAGQVDATTASQALGRILDRAAPGGTVDPVVLDGLIARAQPAITPQMAGVLRAAHTRADLEARLQYNLDVVKRLDAALATP